MRDRHKLVTKAGQLGHSFHMRHVATASEPHEAPSQRPDGTGLEGIRLVVIVANSFLLLVVRPGAPSSVLAPSSDARSP